MRRTLGILSAGFLLAAANLAAQQPCPKSPVVINTPEDKLMLAVNGADSAQSQVDALNKFVADNPNSNFIPCVNEYLTVTYVKMQDFDKAVEAGEKDLAVKYMDVNLLTNLMKAYVGAGKASDSAFELINQAPEVLHGELGATSSDASKDREGNAELSKDIRAYMEYAFFALLPRVSEPTKRIQDLDDFLKAYPDTTNMNQVNVQYFAAYQMMGNADKMYEYGNKAAESDAANASTLNMVADAFATAQKPHIKEATEYAKKALALATDMQKKEGMTDDQFKTFKDLQLGLAHATLGYIQMTEGSASHRVAPAITEFKTALDLLNSNPQLEARTLYFLGYAYELIYPPNHRLAADALTKCVAMDTPWKGQAQSLLAKVRSAR